MNAKLVLGALAVLLALPVASAYTIYPASPPGPITVSGTATSCTNVGPYGTPIGYPGPAWLLQNYQGQVNSNMTANHATLAVVLSTGSLTCTPSGSLFIVSSSFGAFGIAYGS